MKKIVSLLFLTFLFAASSFARYALVSPTTNNGLPIVARKYPTVTLSVNSTYQAKPFDLTSDEVKYKYDESFNNVLNVGAWSLNSNSDQIDITIQASPLVHTENLSAVINYWLYFKLDDSNGITVESGQDSTSQSLNKISGENNIVAVQNKPIFFMLAEGVDITSDEYPAGDYKANVTITVTAGGDL